MYIQHGENYPKRPKVKLMLTTCMLNSYNQSATVWPILLDYAEIVFYKISLLALVFFGIVLRYVKNCRNLGWQIQDGGHAVSVTFFEQNYRWAWFF